MKTGVRMLKRLSVILMMGLVLAGCSTPQKPEQISRSTTAFYPNETPKLHRLIQNYSAAYGVPVDLVQRVVHRESTHNPKARNGPYYGLMQIRPQTAQTMGYQGKPAGLLEAETNLKYGIKYLRGAWLVADGDRDEAVSWYSRGYYYEAKRKGLLEETGLRP